MSRPSPRSPGISKKTRIGCGTSPMKWKSRTVSSGSMASEKTGSWRSPTSELRACRAHQDAQERSNAAQALESIRMIWMRSSPDAFPDRGHREQSRPQTSAGLSGLRPCSESNLEALEAHGVDGYVAPGRAKTRQQRTE